MSMCMALTHTHPGLDSLVMLCASILDPRAGILRMDAQSVFRASHHDCLRVTNNAEFVGRIIRPVGSLFVITDWHIGFRPRLERLKLSFLQCNAWSAH